MKASKFLIVIAGPTASGKTAMAVQLAKWLKCQVISGDSRQFYRELSIGTAKPSAQEMDGVKHHFIDCISVEQEFSAGRFEVAVLELLPEIFSTSDFAILVGGSGLYIQAVCQGMNDTPIVGPDFRRALYEELKAHGLSVLLEELRTKDPVYYESVDRNNPQRIIRALEICRGSGMPYSSFRTDQRAERDFNIIKIGLNLPREELFRRIDERMDQMLKDGLFEEAKSMYPFRHLNALKTVGYTEIFNFLDGQYDETEMIRLLKRNSRKYAKRQLTWFSKDQEYSWFHPQDFNGIINHIQQKTNQVKQ
ncbi:MAG: tRNA (adenosine(37)-N6)-dimethylallyltransferase MiaA [Cyclobacteriaceae bacterium]|nr:tRNA (adenosine(37)-N6)-dimethylallyltransferase MiaA [Cyclobacteriaceae bacterium]